MADLQITNLVKKFEGNTVVDKVSLEVKDGEFVVLLGPSGCGKTTTLRCIAGMETPDGGDILVAGKSVKNLQPKDRDVAMVFQNYALYPHMSVYDNIAFPLRMRKMSKDKIDQRVKDVAKLLHLERLLRRKPKQLSGGEQQRVALGRAIVRRPKLFLMDEPLSNLDAKPPVQYAGGDKAPSKRVEDHDGVRYARPGGSDGPCGSGRRDEQRRDPPV